MNDIIIPYKNMKLKLKLKNIDVDIIRPSIQNQGEEMELTKKISMVFERIEWNNFLTNMEEKFVLIVVNDATRSTPTKKLLSHLIFSLERKKLDYNIIIATGSHKKPSITELNKIFGDLYSKVTEKILIHDSKDDLNLIMTGTTSFKTPLYLNSILLDNKVGGIITINSIEPHYFAGWTGGRKSIVPGLAGEETIKCTHKHALNPNSEICKLKGNPVHEDLQEGFEIFLEKIKGNYFTFQLIVNSEGYIQEIFAGKPSVFEDGVKFAKKIFQVPIKYEYDLVLAVVYSPLDKSIYQAHKALENAKTALNKIKSNFLLISPCQDGIGPDAFLEPFKRNLNKSNQEINNWIKENYKLGYHKTVKIIEALNYCDLYIYSDLDPESIIQSKFKGINEDLNNFINKIIVTKNIKRALLILDAGVTVPVIKK